MNNFEFYGSLSGELREWWYIALTSTTLPLRFPAFNIYLCRRFDQMYVKFSERYSKFSKNIHKRVTFNKQITKLNFLQETFNSFMTGAVII